MTDMKFPTRPAPEPPKLRPTQLGPNHHHLSSKHSTNYPSVEGFKLSRSQSAGKLAGNKQPPPRPPPPPLKLLKNSKSFTSYFHFNKKQAIPPSLPQSKSGSKIVKSETLSGLSHVENSGGGGLLIDLSSPPSSPTLTARTSSDNYSLNSYSSVTNSQIESGFEDDFDSLIISSSTSVSQGDPWGDSLILDKKQNIENFPAFELSNEDPRSRYKALNNTLTTSSTKPTIIRPKNSKPARPPPPKLRPASTPPSLMSQHVDWSSPPEDWSPPMPSCPPPPPPPEATLEMKNMQYERLAQLKCPKDMVKVIDIDWAAPDTPVLATEDGCLRIMDCKLTQSASSLPDYTFKDPVCCPALLPPAVYSHLQLLLSTRLLGPPSLMFTVEDGFSLEHLQAVNDQVDMMCLSVLDRSELSTAARSLLVALLTRDLVAVNFWTVCSYYVQVAACLNQRGEPKPKPVEHYDSFSASDLKRINQFPHLEPLDTCYDVLCDPFSYQRLQLERVGVHEWRRGDYKHTQKVVERLILLGEMDRAVQLLLETDLDNPHYYTDGIKACLVATIQSTGAAQSTIKLVATNLIANGKIWEGVQLLCLIGKGLDGCRYLSSYGLWESAVWLAKSTLPPAETLEVLRKWADHLILQGEKEAATLLMLSQGQMDRVLEMLLVQGQVGRAGLLLEALDAIKHPIDKSLFVSVQSRFCEHTSLCGSLSEAMAKLQPICS